MNDEKAKLGLLRLSNELQQYLKVLINTTKGVGLMKIFIQNSMREGTSIVEEQKRIGLVDESAVNIFRGAQPEVLKKLHKRKDYNGLWTRINFDNCLGGSGISKRFIYKYF